MNKLKITQIESKKNIKQVKTTQNYIDKWSQTKMTKKVIKIFMYRVFCGLEIHDKLLIILDNNTLYQYHSRLGPSKTIKLLTDSTNYGTELFLF